MQHIHAMLIEDEIMLCGIVLGLGVVSGALLRVVAYARRRSRAKV